MTTAAIPWVDTYNGSTDLDGRFVITDYVDDDRTRYQIYDRREHQGIDLMHTSLDEAKQHCQDILAKES